MQKRIVWLDWVKFFAVGCVVLTHVLEEQVLYNYPILENTGSRNQIILYTLYSFGRMGVPLFLLTSGYLLLPRNYTQEHSIRFWKQHVFPLFITTEIWIVLSELFWAWYQQTHFDYFFLIKTMLFLSNGHLGHLWYMPMIIGVYIMIPFVSNALANFSQRLLVAFLLFFFIFYSVIPTVNPLLAALQRAEISDNPGSSIELMFCGGYYGLTLILGYLIRMGSFDRISKKSLVFGFIIFTVLTVSQQYYCLHCGFHYILWYNNALLILSSFCLFLFFSRTHFPPSKLAVTVSNYSLGIYFIHFPLIMLIERRIVLNNYFIEIFFLFILAYLFSILFICLCRSSKICAKYLLCRPN